MGAFTNSANIKGRFMQKEEEGKIDINHSAKERSSLSKATQLGRDSGLPKTSRIVFDFCFCSL